MIAFSLYNHPFLQKIGCEVGNLETRKFPDEETYIRIHSDVKNKETIIVDSLDRPDKKIFPLIILSQTLKDLGAKKVHFIAPYLAYMRQDKIFQEGEGISSRYFAHVISNHFDSISTIDPHLHRYKSLDEIYTIPNQVLHAAPLVAKWIKQNLRQPLLIGPDKESGQWVSHIADMAEAPFVVLEKKRYGDRNVEVSSFDIKQHAQNTLVLIDDIISSGRTMIETAKHLPQKPVCIGIHAVFAENAYEQLSQVADVVTCNTIKHVSNKIDISPLIHINTIKSFIC